MSIKTIDMYGQPIQFSYKNSTVFSSTYGKFSTIIVVICILIYSILLLLDSTSLKKPNIIESSQALFIPPEYFFMTDYYGLFNPNETYYNNNDSISFNTAFIQISVGLQNINTFEWLDLDPSYFYIQINILDQEYGSTTPLYFEKCKRFPFISQNSFDLSQIDKTYCIYSPFSLYGSSVNSIFKRMTIDLNKCKNNTIAQFSKKENGEYQRLAELYKEYKMNNTNSPMLNPFISTDPSYDWTTLVNNNSLNNYINYTDDTINPHVRLLNPNETSPNTVQCANSSDILNRIYNSKLVLFLTNSALNSTNFDNITSYYVDKQKYLLINSLKKTTTLYFQNDKIIIYNSIIPSAMLNTSITKYLMNVNPNDVENTYGDPDDTKPFFEMVFQTSSFVNTYTLTYINIFDIIGLIGGLAKIFLVVGSVFVYYIADLRMKESLINEFYSVIDPSKLDTVSKNFETFLAERANSFGLIQENKKQKKEQNEKEDPKANNKITLLEEFFDEELVEKLIEYLKTNNKSSELKKFEIVYEVYKHHVYSNFSYSYWEIFLNLFFCCRSKHLKLKNKTFEKACKALERDTDFLSIIKSIQEFENLKKSFLDEGQYYLFNSFANNEITAAIVEEKELSQKEKSSRKKEYEKIINTNRSKKQKNNKLSDEASPIASPHKSPDMQLDKIITTNYEDYKAMQRLKNNLECVMNEDRIFDEIDHKLLKNLVDADKKYIAKEFIGERMKKNKKNNEIQQINDMPKKELPEINENDIKEINKRFSKK